MFHVSESCHSVVSNSVTQDLYYISYDVHSPVNVDNVACVLNFLIFRAHVKEMVHLFIQERIISHIVIDRYYKDPFL